MTHVAVRAGRMDAHTRQAILAALRRIHGEVSAMIVQVEGWMERPRRRGAVTIQLVGRGAGVRRALGRLNREVVLACPAPLAREGAQGDATAVQLLLDMVARSRRFLCLFCRLGAGRDVSPSTGPPHRDGRKWQNVQPRAEKTSDA